MILNNQRISLQIRNNLVLTNQNLPTQMTKNKDLIWPNLNGFQLIRLKSYFSKKRFLTQSNNLQLFKELQHNLQQALNHSQFFHGTGAKQYFCHLGNKYEDQATEPIDTLASILKHGIVPKPDYLNPQLKIKANKTVSLTPFLIYARMHACMYFTEGENLGYQLGNNKSWWRFFERSHRNLKVQGINLAEKADMRVKDFRKDHKYSQCFAAAIKQGRSDIQNNFPVIIGIKQNTVTPLKTCLEEFDTWEIRTDRKIEAEYFAMILVPLKNWQKVKTQLAKAHPQLAVYPIEFAELLLSQ